MKLLGAILIVAACGFWGTGVYAKAVKQRDYINGLISGFEFLKSEISFSRSVLSELFIKASKFSGTAECFFCGIGEGIGSDGVSLEKFFKNNSCEIEAAVSKDVYEIISEIILQIGSSDTENQILLLNSGIDKLKNCLNKQDKFCEKEGIMCKKTGVVAGIAVAILLL